MARVTELEVKGIIDTALTAEEVTPFLTSAETFVQSACATDTRYTTADLLSLTLFLAAHLVSIRDPRVRSETILGASQDLAVSENSYLKTAITLDPYGAFSAAVKGVGGSWIEALV